MSVSSPPPATDRLKVALVGNPNTGKSTLFNALAGMRARVGNYPGVTVEKKIARVEWSGRPVDVIDLPGTYSISPRSLDEVVSVDVLLGQQPDVGNIDVVVCIVDASNLERNFYLLSQVLDLGRPTVLVLNMWDTLQSRGLSVDVAALSERLNVPVVVTEAHRKRGLGDLRDAILATAGSEAPSRPRILPEAFYEECDRLQERLEELGENDAPFFLRERMLLDPGGTIEQRYLARANGELSTHLHEARRRLKDGGHTVSNLEPERRYQWARDVLDRVVTAPEQRQTTVTDRIDALLTHRVAGPLILAAVMLLVFQTLYTWAEPLMGACETAQAWVGARIEPLLAPGPFRSLLIDGVVAGVGSFLIFLPQIALLFLFIAILEGCGYMARAAYMMDRLMAPLGLSGRAFLPLMSSFACAVPGIMATRVIQSRRERMVTILIAPLMSCSARLPVYVLMIGAFIPGEIDGRDTAWMQGLVLFAMSCLGLIVAVPSAWLLKRTFFKGEASAFVMELPDYRLPSPFLVLRRVYESSLAFVMRAGTLIFATTILVWAAGYFPGDHSRLESLQQRIAELEQQGESPELERLQIEHNRLSGSLIRESYLGRAGQVIEPVVKPLGWDWRIGVGVIASFPAREVIIATLGTIYSLGGDVDVDDEESRLALTDAMQQATWPDGRPVFNIPVALSIMVFFALCAQCVSTLVIMRRETNSWRWPAFSFVSMTLMAYLGALITYQVGMLFT